MRNRTFIYYMAFFLIFVSSIKIQRNQIFIPIKGGIDEMYYYVEFTVGAQNQVQSAIIDTGSDLLAFPCDKCPIDECSGHKDPRYLSIESSSFDIKIDCPAKFQTENGRVCKFTKNYLEGSSISGFRASDLFKFKSQLHASGISMSTHAANSPKELVLKAEFGCTTKETGLFVNQLADGIFGLDNSSSFLKSIENQNDGTSSIVSFGVCFHKRGGYMTFEAPEKGSLFPLPDKEKFLVAKYDDANFDYNLHLNEIKIGNKVIAIDGILTTFDTGTTYTMFPMKIAEEFFNNFNEYCSENSSNCAYLKAIKLQNGFCLRFVPPDPNFESLEQALKTFPTIELIFEGTNKPYLLKPENYFAFDDKKENKSACISVAGDITISRIILGSFSMIDHLVMFDRSNKAIVVEDTDCVQVSEGILKSGRILSDKIPGKQNKPWGMYLTGVSLGVFTAAVFIKIKEIKYN